MFDKPPQVYKEEVRTSFDRKILDRNNELVGGFDEQNNLNDYKRLVLLAPGSGLVQRGPRDKKIIFLDINIFSKIEDFKLIVSINLGEAVIEQAIRHDKTQKKYEINLTDVAKKAKSNLEWKDLYKLSISMVPKSEVNEDGDDQFTTKYNFLIDHGIKPEKISNNVAEEKGIKLDSLQALALTPERKWENKEGYEAEKGFHYFEDKFSHTLIEFNNWDEHDYYTDVAWIYSFDDDREIESANYLSDISVDKLELENKEGHLNTTIDQYKPSEHWLPEYNEEFGYENIKVVLLEFSEPSYYDYKIKNSKIGFGKYSPPGFGYQVPFNLDNDLNVEVKGTFSNYFKNIILINHYEVGKPELDKYNGKNILKQEEYDHTSDDLKNYQYEFKFDKDGIDDLTHNDGFSLDDLLNKYGVDGHD